MPIDFVADTPGVDFEEDDSYENQLRAQGVTPAQAAAAEEEAGQRSQFAAEGKAIQRAQRRSENLQTLTGAGVDFLTPARELLTGEIRPIAQTAAGIAAIQEMTGLLPPGSTEYTKQQFQRSPIQFIADVPPADSSRDTENLMRGGINSLKRVAEFLTTPDGALLLLSGRGASPAALRTTAGAIAIDMTRRAPAEFKAADEALQKGDYHKAGEHIGNFLIGTAGGATAARGAINRPGATFTTRPSQLIDEAMAGQTRQMFERAQRISFEPETTAARQEMAAAMADLQNPNETISPQPLITPEPVKQSNIPAAAEVITESQRMARENVTAMQQLARLKAEEGAANAAGQAVDEPTIVGSGRTPSLGPRPDGLTDVLDHIQELGGINSERTEHSGGEYDGFNEAFGTGPARLLRRKGGGRKPDQLMHELNDTFGYNFQTPDDLYQAATKASTERQGLKEKMKRAEALLAEEAAAHEAQQAKVNAIAFEIRTAPNPEAVSKIVARRDARETFAKATEQQQAQLDAEAARALALDNPETLQEGYQGPAKRPTSGRSQWLPGQGSWILKDDTSSTPTAEEMGGPEAFRAQEETFGTHSTAEDALREALDRQRARAERTGRGLTTGLTPEGKYPPPLEFRRLMRETDEAFLRRMQEARPPNQPPPKAPPGTPPDIAKAHDELREAWGDQFKQGIIPDPIRDAKATFRLYKALFNLGAAYAKQGVTSAAEFARKAGIELTALVQRAWNDATAGKPAASPQELPASLLQQTADEFHQRSFSKRFDADTRIAEQIREATGNANYAPVSNALTAAEAFSHVKERGIDGARADMMNETNGLEPRTRSAIAQAIIQKLNAQYAKTPNEGLLEKAADTAEWLTEYGTRLGQGVQSFAIWNRMTPEGLAATYRRAVKRAGGKADENTAKEIARKTRQAQQKPEGFQRDEAMADVLAEVARAKGVKKWDIATALWYGNILSGWTTQVRNLAGNLGNLIAEASAHMAAKPSAIPDVLAGLYQGAIRGGPEALKVVQAGKITGTRMTKLEAPRVLELVRFKGPAYPLNAWKYVFRVMSAADMTFFRSTEEMRARWLGREIAKSEGLRGHALTRRMAEILHNTPAARNEASARATEEGLTGLNHRRRTAEIIEQSRPPHLVEGAAEYGRTATFNNRPQGVLGVLANSIGSASARFAPLRLVVPFTNIVANVANASLNYTPWGFYRMFPSRFLDHNWMQEDATPLDYRVQAARATLGTVGLAAIYALASSHDKDEQPRFQLTSMGPLSKAHRDQLKQSGWQPYSVRIGEKWYNYQNTPMQLGLAWLGHIQDGKRYNRLDDAASLQRSAYVLQQIGSTMLNQSFLSGLATFIDDLAQDRIQRTGTPGNWARRTAGTAIPNLAKQIDRVFDPQVYDDATVKSALLRDVPIARRWATPKINVLGEAIKSDQNPFYSVQRPDELWQTIAARQLWIPEPSKTAMVGDRAIEPDEYYDWVKSSGQGIRTRLDAIEPLLAIEPRERAQKRVNAIVEEERSRAWKQVFGGIKRHSR